MRCVVYPELRNCPEIQTFADRDTERFYTVGRSRRKPTEIRKRAATQRS